MWKQALSTQTEAPAQGSGHPSLALSAKLNRQSEFHAWSMAGGGNLLRRPCCPEPRPAFRSLPCTPLPGLQALSTEPTRSLLLLKIYLGLKRLLSTAHSAPILTSFSLCTASKDSLHGDPQPAPLPPAEVWTHKCLPACNTPAWV